MKLSTSELGQQAQEGTPNYVLSLSKYFFHFFM